MSVVRFKREFRRHLPGTLDGEMTYGVHDALVLRGIAEWVDQSPESVAVISQPVLAEQDTTRASKSRRIFSKETRNDSSARD